MQSLKVRRAFPTMSASREATARPTEQAAVEGEAGAVCVNASSTWLLQTSQRTSSTLREAQRKPAIRFDRVATYTDNFKPPEWWTSLLRAELEPRGASASLLRAAKAAFGVDYDKGKLSRLAKDQEGATVEMLTHLSLILGLPIPIFVVSSERNAKRMLGEALLCEEVDPKMLKIAAGVRHLLVRGHTDSVKTEHGREPDPGDRPKPKR